MLRDFCAVVFLISILVHLSSSQQCNLDDGRGNLRYSPVTQRDNGEVVELRSTGLKGWTIIPENFIRTIWGNVPFPYVVFTDTGNRIAAFVAGDGAIVAVGVLGFVFGFIFLVCCVSVCCCWCCCCVFHEDEDDSKSVSKSEYQRLLMSFICIVVLVSLLLILLLAGGIIGLVANAFLRDSMIEFPDTIISSLEGWRDFFEGIDEDLRHVALDGFTDTLTCTDERLRDSGTLLRDHASIESFLDSSNNCLVTLESDVYSFRSAVSVIAANASTLGTELEIIACSSCMTMLNGQALVAASVGLNSSAVMISSNDLSTFKTDLNTIENMLNNSISAINDLDITTLNAIPDINTTVTDFLNELEGSLQSQFDSIISTLDLQLRRAPDPDQPFLRYDTFIDLWYWLAVSTCVMVLFVILIIAIGLILGGTHYSCRRCRKRKRCSNLGGRILLIGSGTLTFTAFVLLICASLTFFTAANGQRFCEPAIFENGLFPQTLDNTVFRFSTVRTFMNLLFGGTEFGDNLLQAANITGSRFEDILRGCQNDQTLWKVAKLETFIDIYFALMDRSMASLSFTQLFEEIDQASRNVQFNDQLNMELMSLATGIAAPTQPSVPDFTTTQSDIEYIYTIANELKSNLTNLAVENGTLMLSSINSTLCNLISQVEQANTTLIIIKQKYENIHNSYGSINTSVEMLKTDLNDNNSSLRMAFEEHSSAIVGYIGQYGRHLNDSLQMNISRCNAFYAGYTNIVNNVCVDTITSLNAFWFACGWCGFWMALLFIPIIILSVKFEKPLEKPQSEDRRSSTQSGGLQLLNRDRRGTWNWQTMTGNNSQNDNLTSSRESLDYQTFPSNALVLTNKAFEKDQPFERTQRAPTATTGYPETFKSMTSRPLPSQPPTDRSASVLNIMSGTSPYEQDLPANRGAIKFSRRLTIQKTEEMPENGEDYDYIEPLKATSTPTPKPILKKVSWGDLAVQPGDDTAKTFPRMPSTKNRNDEPPFATARRPKIMKIQSTNNPPVNSEVLANPNITSRSPSPEYTGELLSISLKFNLQGDDNDQDGISESSA